MYEEYSISGIKQSYQYTSRSKTIILPVLMMAVVAAMVIFYIKGNPSEIIDAEPIAVAKPTTELSEETPADIATESDSEFSAPASSEVVPPAEETAEPVSESDESELPKTAENLIEPADEENFTPWMAPLALDTYIRAKTQGTGKTFWDSGHWITAVEGRWKEGVHQFRISYEKNPEIDSWQWRYKVNQSQDDFASSVSGMVEQGFTLVQTQTYRQEDGNHRYQGVWHRKLEAPKIVEILPAQEVPETFAQTQPEPTTTNPTAPVQAAPSATVSQTRTMSSSSVEPRGLNVNRLNFR